LAFEDAPRALSTATATTTTSGAVPYYMRKFGTKAKSMLTYKSASQLEDGGGARTSDIHLPEPAEDAENSDYASYVQFSENPGALESQWNGTAYQEFTMSLADVNLPPDEVAGIKKLAESAHITREIQKGPYEGLLQDTSAQEVAKLVHEQLGVLGSAADREAEEPGALGEAQVLVRKTLERSGMGGSAVADTIQQSFEELQVSPRASEASISKRASLLSHISTRSRSRTSISSRSSNTGAAAEQRRSLRKFRPLEHQVHELHTHGRGEPGYV